jgi:serine protease Do
VDDSSAAFKTGLKKGDIILQFDGKAVNSTNELIEDLQEARQKPSVKVKIQRGTISQEIELKIPRKLKTADL